MINITIDSKELDHYLKELQSRTSNLSPVMRKISGYMLSAVEENFEKEGRPDEFAPLSRKTIEYRAKLGKWPGKILQLSGQLAASVSSSYSNTEAIVGTNKAYAAIHQFGGYAGRNRKVYIPPRPFLTLTNDDIDSIIDMLQNYVLKND